jgi:hypothetical protein
MIFLEVSDSRSYLRLKQMNDTKMGVGFLANIND